MIDLLQHNRDAWNAESTSGESPWCHPVDPATIQAARAGDWTIVLTPNKAVPADWLDDVRGKEVLCLASGGGQQAPVLAAAGARVTSYDLSDEQLAKDAAVAEREGLDIVLERGDMADLSRFADARFDLIVNAVSNVFVPDVRAVWRECHRVLVPGGRLVAGFMNPDFFLFDQAAVEAGGLLLVQHALPYADARDLPLKALQQRLRRREPLQFSHSLEDQIGGQTDAGFAIIGLYEDRWSDEATPLNPYMPTSIATLAVKPP